ncbi:MAG: carboxylesterase family protein [Bacteroidota bacterium]
MIGSCHPSDPHLVQIKQGQIRGLTEDGVRVWKGIPYAKPPVGPLRWKAPQEPDTWEGIRKAQHYGNICPQMGYGETSIYEIPSESMSEDCLYLNVWSSNVRPSAKQPVFVWIHGGSLTREGGSHPQYLGKNLAKKGLVYVSINYRLNAFGFLAHPELSDESPDKVSGNYGIMDQIMALEWVQENIQAFGGDPDNVTIAGESAGGWSVTLLTACKKATGLFHKAIAQSGVYLWPGPHLKVAHHTYLSGEEEGRQFMQQLGAKTLEDMRALPTEDIVSLFFSSDNVLSSEPMVDGHIFQEDIVAIYAQSRHNKVDIITGANSDEWSLWIPEDLTTDPARYRAEIARRFPGREALFFEAYPVHDSRTIRQAYTDFLSDQNFHLHNRSWAKEMHKAGSRVFMYYFSKTPEERYPTKYGAFHGAEIVYTLNNLENDPGPIGSGVFSDAELAYADQVSDYWVNFAKHGDPNGNGLPPWPEWNPIQEPYLSFGEKIQSKGFLLKNRLDKLEDFLAAE